MGLKLNGLVPSRPATGADLAERTVAIDVANLAYAFYATQLAGREVDDARRRAALASAARGVAARVDALAVMGARSVLVLDGPPHPAKEAHLALRDAARSVPPIHATDYAAIVAPARAKGAPVVEAPHDAEGQACAMARDGLVDVVATTDWDALAMGAPRILRNLSGAPGGGGWTLVDAPAAFLALGVTRDALAAAAVLMGCDYYPGFDGIGPKRALRLVGAAGAADPLEHALDALGVPADARAAPRLARDLLRDPPARPVGGLFRESQQLRLI